MTESGVANAMIQKNIIRGDISSLMFYVMILLVVSLPLSEFGMSVSQFLLLGLWAYEGADFQNTSLKHHNRFSNYLITLGNNLAGKFRMVYSNHSLLIFLSIYFIHIAGLLYTTDFNYALKDIRVKLPLLSLPILIATSKALNFKKFKLLMILFCVSVISGSLISIYVMLTRQISDPREISVFISHIRFSLLICYAIFIMLYFLLKNTYKSNAINASLIIGTLWLVIFLFILKSLTGIVIIGLLFITMLIILTIRYRKYAIPATILLLILCFSIFYYVKDVYKDITVAENIHFRTLDQHTALGNVYVHDTSSYGIEYGSYVGIYLSINELRDEWNGRSSFKFDSLDKKGQQLKYTLIRYLHSKGYRKDADAVNKLTDADVHNIENGVTNANYLNNFDIRARVEQLLLGYRSYRYNNDPNASSFMQRLEYWKTSLYLIKANPLFGYGTGDLDLVFNQAYNDTNSRLNSEYRHRSHNQFLAIAIAFGVIGLIIFMFGLFYPPIYLGKFNNYFYIIFFIIAMISMLTEDTLETQAGVTFFAFFNALLLFGIQKEIDDKASILLNRE